MKNTAFFKIFLIFALSVFLFSCNSQQQEQKKRIVIWTSCSEFVQYIELFNTTHKENSAILVYKENPALSIPPASDETPPDIIIGSWLRNDKPYKNFKPLDYIFYNKILNSDIFYQQLFDAGQKNEVQFLLPVSFNLPAIVFSQENKELVPDNYTLTLEQIRKTGAEFNKKNKKGTFTKIGFTPLSNNDFLYLFTKIFDVDFREQKYKIIWNPENLKKATDELKDWVFTENESAQTELDFAFKYLFMPYYRQVTSDRTLYAYTTSDQLFKTIKNQDFGIDYRWIVQDKKIPIEDSMIMLGIYKDCQNQPGATEFISWFFNADNQQKILERKEKLNLDTELFGISGGFSSIRDVTEHILPVFYTHLLTNLPPSQMLSVPQKLPARWDSYKSLVIEPYLRSVITAQSEETVTTIEDLESEWRRKVFD